MWSLKNPKPLCSVHSPPPKPSTATVIITISTSSSILHSSPIIIMSSSRLISLFSSSIFHHRTALSPSSPIPLNFFHSRIPPLQFRRCFSSAAVAIDSIASKIPVDIPSDSYHPWPEWVDFIDRLKAKGYIHTRPEDDSAGDRMVDGDVYKDIALLKDATLCFARDRFDLFKLLSEEDIRTVVGSGCPNTLRKSVNSAKRLRAYFELDEGDVCGACNLRESCDRAYVVLKDSESAARTVDIVRILLFHALDPLVLSGGDKPSQRVRIESSARNLLSHLITLSETPIDPAISKVVVQAVRRKERPSNSKDDEFPKDVEMKRGDWMCTKCNFLNFAKNVRCLKCKEDDGPRREDGPRRVGSVDAEMKKRIWPKGDWTCPECNFLNFAKNVRCFKCKEDDGPRREDGPRRVGSVDAEMKKGDWTCPESNFLNFAKEDDGPRRVGSVMKKGVWTCPECSFMNFSRNARCLKCETKGPEKIGVDDVEMKKGDWNCPSCNFMNFANNTKCLRCSEGRPKGLLNPGEWECPLCNFLNYKRNVACFKCDLERPGQWECPSCNFLNFRRNVACLKCDCERPKEAETQYEEQIWNPRR